MAATPRNLVPAFAGTTFVSNFEFLPSVSRLAPEIWDLGSATHSPSVDVAARGGLVPRVLADLGLESSARVVRLLEHWEEAVGPEIARHCQPTALRGEVLEATVDSSAWCQQLQLEQPAILAALRQVAGDDAPRALWLRVGVRPQGG